MMAVKKDEPDGHNIIGSWTLCFSEFPEPEGCVFGWIRVEMPTVWGFFFYQLLNTNYF